MEENRASSAKQDLADIVKLFQRLNAQKVFSDLDTAAQLRDIPSCQLQQHDMAKTFEGLSSCDTEEHDEDGKEDVKDKKRTTTRDEQTSSSCDAITEKPGERISLNLSLL